MRLKVTGREQRVLGDRQLQPHQQQLDQGDEEEAERGDDHHPADVLVVGAGGDLDPARAAAGEAVDDELGRGRSWHFSLFDQAHDAVLGSLDVGLLAFDEVFVFLRARRRRPRSASPRRPGRRRSPTGRGRRPLRRRGRRRGWSCRGRRRACRRAAARPRCGSRRSRPGRVRPWCRPGRRACNRRRLRWGSRSATATAGRSLRSSAARSGPRRGRPGRWPGSRAPCRCRRG